MPSELEQTAGPADGLDFAEAALLPHSDNDISAVVPDTAISISQTETHNSDDDAPGDNVGALDGTNDNSVAEAVADDGGELAEEPDILRCLADDLKLAGLVGEERTAIIIFLAATSRLFASPLSVAVKGPSGGGKSHAVRQALCFLPPTNAGGDRSRTICHPQASRGSIAPTVAPRQYGLGGLSQR